MTDTIYKKFAAAWESVENPPLDSVNPGYKSKYASLGAVMRVIRKACKGIVYQQVWETHERNETEDTLTINTWVMDTEGNRIDLSKLATPIESNPQRQGGIITYYRRYVACTDWGIVGEEDDDAESAMPKKPKPGKPDLTAKLRELTQACKEAGVTSEGVKGWYQAEFGDTPVSDLTEAEKRKAVEHYKELLRDAKERL